MGRDNFNIMTVQRCAIRNDKVYKLFTNNVYTYNLTFRILVTLALISLLDFEWGIQVLVCLPKSKFLPFLNCNPYNFWTELWKQCSKSPEADLHPTLGTLVHLRMLRIYLDICFTPGHSWSANLVVTVFN